MRFKNNNHELLEKSYSYSKDRSNSANDPINHIEAPTNGPSTAPTNRSSSRTNAPTNRTTERTSSPTTGSNKPTSGQSSASTTDDKEKRDNTIAWLWLALALAFIIVGSVMWIVMSDAVPYMWYIVIAPYIAALVTLVALLLWLLFADCHATHVASGVLCIVLSIATIGALIFSIVYVCTNKQDSIDLYSNGLYYSVKDDGTLQLERPGESSSYQMEKLVIPEEVNGKIITSISEKACHGNRNLREVVLTNNIKEIPSNAFSGSGLVSITIPDSVTYIGEGVFRGCDKLESITLPFVGDSAKSIDDTNQYPFGFIFGIVGRYNLDATEQMYIGEDGTASSEIYGIPKSLKSVTVTGNSIPYGAFSNCRYLTNIYLSDNITSIGTNAFYGCDSLQYNVYNNDQYLGNNDNPYAALISLSSDALTTCAINKGTKVIAASAYYGSGDLKNVYYTGSVADWCNINFSSESSNPLYYADNLYINGELVTSVTLDDTVTEIKDYAFYNYKLLTSVAMSDSVTRIGDNAFYDCLSLQNATFGNGLQSIGKYAFYNCYMMTGSIVIPDSIVTISDYAFCKCDGLTKVTIGAGVQRIDCDIFSECPYLKSINYNGTMEKWFLVEKDVNWNSNKVIKTVVCTDGAIDLL